MGATEAHETSSETVAGSVTMNLKVQLIPVSDAYRAAEGRWRA